MYFHPMIYKGTKKTASTMNMNKSDLRKCMGAFAFSLLLLTATTVRTYAQSSLELGVKGGGDYMKIGGRSFDGKHYPGFQAGAYGQLNFTSKWSLQPELYFSQTIGKTSDEFNGIYGGPSGQQVTLDYVDLPILLSFKPIPELSLLLGPQVGYAFSQTTNLLPPTTGATDAFKKVDFSIVFGGQLNLGKVAFGLRYQAGLNNISFRTTDTWRQFGAQFYVAYQLKDMKLKKK
jgi:Outer membrane protein beta-barrel domain